MTEEKDIKEEIKKEDKKVKKENKKHKKEDNTVKLTKEEVEALNLKIKELDEKAMRAQAELVNYRKRKDEEVEKMLKYANEDLITEILPVLDNFERAIKMDDDNLEDEVSQFLQGIKMVYSALLSVLEKYDVKEIEALGLEFDPSVHQGVMTDHVEGKEENVILEVFQKGYMLKEKVIRPAMVKVNK